MANKLNCSFLYFVQNLHLLYILYLNEGCRQGYASAEQTTLTLTETDMHLYF